MNGQIKFKLEALEPRLLLNGDGVVDLEMVDPCADSGQPIAAIEIQLESQQVLSAHQKLTYEAGNILEGLDGVVLEKDAEKTASEEEELDNFTETVTEDLSKNFDAEEETSEVTQYDDSFADLNTPNFEENDSASKADELVETLHAPNGPPADEALNFLTNQQITGSDVQTGGRLYPCNFVHLAPEQVINGSLIVDSESILSGTVQGHLQNAGLVSPGDSSGIQNVDTFTQTAGGTLQIEIAGTGGARAADGHDQLVVANGASLNGTLEIVLFNGFIFYNLPMEKV